MRRNELANISLWQSVVLLKEKYKYCRMQYFGNGTYPSTAVQDFTQIAIGLVIRLGVWHSLSLPNTACTRLVGVDAFSGSLRRLELVPSKWCFLIPPLAGNADR